MSQTSEALRPATLSDEQRTQMLHTLWSDCTQFLIVRTVSIGDASWSDSEVDVASSLNDSVLATLGVDCQDPELLGKSLLALQRSEALFKILTIRRENHSGCDAVGFAVDTPYRELCDALLTQDSGNLAPLLCSAIADVAANPSEDAAVQRRCS